MRHMRALASEAEYRAQCGEFVCDGEKTLNEALAAGAEICRILWRDGAERNGVPSAEQYTAPDDLVEYASPLKAGHGPVFTVKMPDEAAGEIRNAIVLENVQDPGNVGTVIRGANAFGIGAVIMTGECADLYNPKTVRATMGAIFRQRVIRADMAEMLEILKANNLKLYGAALSDRAQDIRKFDLSRCAVAVGSEGRGLSRELLLACDGEIIIPMRPEAESLNAAVAASIIMWEMSR